MERGEPSLVPEWLRSTSGGGTSSHHFAASQADASVSALPKRNGLSKCTGNSNAPHSSNSRRTSSSNGSTKHDRNSYSRSCTSFNRSHREKDRERSTITDNWDLEYSDPLRSMISRRTEGVLRRSLSMISRRQGEIQPRRISTDNGNGTHTVGTGVTAIRKVSFGTDERPKTPDIVRVSSPGLSRSIHVLSIGNSSLIGNEGWTSALAEVPTTAPQPSSPAVSGGSSNVNLGGGSKLGGLNMAEALVQTPARSQNLPQPSSQSHRDELAFAQSKKLIPMTPSLPKALINQFDKLKPKTPGRSNELTVVPKNGVHQPSPSQLSGQSTRATTTKVESPKSPGKLLVLKPGRGENGGPTIIKDIQSPTTISNNKVVPNNNQSKRNVQSRSDFFKMMRKKSMSTTSVETDSGTGADMVDKTDEVKEVLGAQTSGENGSEVKCNGENCTSVPESFEDENAGVYPNEEEKAFLRSLGWEENAGDDEALTEEEINAFYQEVWRLRATSKLCRDRWPKILSHFDIGASCPSTASTEPSASTSRN